MKKSIFIIFIISFHAGSFAQNQFAFSGKISGKVNCVALFYTNAAGKSVKEVCPLKNGLFSFKGDTKEPQLAFFYAYDSPNEARLNDDDPNSTSFFLEPGNITATGSYGHLKAIKITGSLTEDENKSFEKQLHLFPGKEDDKKHQYITGHTNSYLSAYYLADFTDNWPLSSVKVLYNKLNPSVKNSAYGKEIQSAITAIDNSTVNKKAINFSSKDINGKPISLSDFKGRYVLLDFWASWCVPCRESNPHLIHIFNKYHSKGLDVIAIADDDAQPDAWKKAVKKDKTKLLHNVLDGRIYINMETQETDVSKSIGKQYAIKALPTKILIDKNGIIIGRYDENTGPLDKKLAQIFGGSD